MYGTSAAISRCRSTGALARCASTSPTQFDPRQAHDSVDRLRALAPGALFLGHYGRVAGAERLADDLHRDLDRFVAIAREHAGAPDAVDRIELEGIIRLR